MKNTISEMTNTPDGIINGVDSAEKMIELVDITIGTATCSTESTPTRQK